MESVKGEFINMKKIVKIILPVVIVAAGFGMFKYSQKSLQSESAKKHQRKRQKNQNKQMRMKRQVRTMKESNMMKMVS